MPTTEAQRKASRKWKENNPEYSQELSRTSAYNYWVNNKERVLEYKRQYYLENREKIKEKQLAKYYEKKQLKEELNELKKIDSNI